MEESQLPNVSYMALILCDMLAELNPHIYHRSKRSIYIGFPYAYLHLGKLRISDHKHSPRNGSPRFEFIVAAEPLEDAVKRVTEFCDEVLAEAKRLPD